MAVAAVSLHHATHDGAAYVSDRAAEIIARTTPQTVPFAVVDAARAALQIDGRASAHLSAFADPEVRAVFHAISSHVWSQTQADCTAMATGAQLNHRPLWPDWNPLAQEWSKARDQTAILGSNWSFWINWYDKILRGEPQDWELLTSVALLPQDDWAKGPEHVNAIISRMVTQRVEALTPYGEEIVVTGEGRFDVRPLPPGPTETIGTVRDAVSYTLDRVAARVCAGETDLYMMVSREVADAQAAVDRYRDHPVRLHDELGSVWRSLSHRMETDLPPDSLLADLERVLDDAQIDLRREYPEVARAHRSRTSVRLRRADGRLLELQGMVAPAAAALSQEALGRDMIEDPRTAAESADEETRDTARYRWVSRLSRMINIARRGSVDVVDDARKLNQGLDAVPALADRAGGALQVLREKGGELLSNIW